MCLIQLYCTDDFWKSFKQEWDKHLIDSGKSKTGREPELTIRLLSKLHLPAKIFDPIFG